MRAAAIAGQWFRRLIGERRSDATTSGGLFLVLDPKACSISGSPIIVEAEPIPDRLPNRRAGEVLPSEFMEPLGLSRARWAELIGVEVSRVLGLLSGRRPTDRCRDGHAAGPLVRHVGRFFLRLRHDHELREFKRHHGAELDRSVPRAAA